MQIETMKIKHANGYAIINKEDYNDKIHTIYSEENTKELVQQSMETAKVVLDETNTISHPEVAAHEEVLKIDSTITPQTSVINTATTTSTPTMKPLKEMTRIELMAMAQSHDINLKSGLDKPRMIEAIEASLALRAGISID